MSHVAWPIPSPTQTAAKPTSIILSASTSKAPESACFFTPRSGFSCEPLLGPVWPDLTGIHWVRHDERDHLVVELKRPKQPINSKILTQAESYALAVAQDGRFQKEKTCWKFIVVSNEMDDHAKRKANQRERRKGLVFDDGDLNIQVWAFEWNEVIGYARARLQFINESLSYEASRESSRNYLEATHAKFIPTEDDLSDDSVTVADDPSISSSEPEPESGM